MAKITAYGEKEIARWTKAGGDTVLLTEGPDGKPGRVLRSWTKGVAYVALVIPVETPSGRPNYSRRVTLAQFERYATANNYEYAKGRRAA